MRYFFLWQANGTTSFDNRHLMFSYIYQHVIYAIIREWQNIFQYWQRVIDARQVWIVTFDSNTIHVDKENFESANKNWEYPDTCGRGQNMHPISKLCVFVSHCGIPKKGFIMRTFHHIVKFQNKLLKKCYVVHTLMFAVSTLYYNKVPV